MCGCRNVRDLFPERNIRNQRCVNFICLRPRLWVSHVSLSHYVRARYATHARGLIPFSNEFKFFVVSFFSHCRR